jgi:hypothetical protein
MKQILLINDVVGYGKVGMAAMLPILSYIATVGLQDEYLYVRAHRYDYEVLCTGIDTITDGENARMFEIDAGHNFITWTTSFYNALLLMF